MSTHKRDFVALAAPSGGGKTTLCEMILSRYPSTMLSISYTTRAPRGSEQNGVAYHFVSESEFQKRIDAGDLVEWAKVHGAYYGTSKRFLEDCVARGKVVILDIDVQGVESLKRKFPDRTLGIFILPPSLEELENRLRSRGTESEEKLQARLAAAREEISHAPGFDARIVNHDLQESFRELCDLLEREVGLVR